MKQKAINKDYSVYKGARAGRHSEERVIADAIGEALFSEAAHTMVGCGHTLQR